MMSGHIRWDLSQMIPLLILIAVLVGTYCERKILKLKLATAEMEATRLRSKVDAEVARGAALRKAVVQHVRTEAATIISDIKAWDEKAKEGTASVIQQFEGRLKQIL